MTAVAFWASIFLASQLPASANDVDVASGDLKPTVARLVRRLGADRLSDRDGAEKSLIDLGPRIEPLLPPVNDRMPAETAQRLKRVRQVIAEVRARASGDASLVTLKAEKMPLADVLAALTTQTGNRIVDWRPHYGEVVTNPALNVDFSKVPFWQALDGVLDKASLTLEAPGAGEIRVAASGGGGSSRRPVAYSGPFRIQATRWDAMRDLRRVNDGTLRLTLNVAWEPRVTLVSLVQPLDKVTAEGSNGEKFDVMNSTARIESAIGPKMTATQILVPFALPPRSVERVTHLTGQLEAVVGSPLEKFEFHDVLSIGKANTAGRAEERRGGVTVVAQAERNKNKSWAIRVMAHFDKSSPALESYRGWVLDNAAFLRDTDGRMIQASSFERTQSSPQDIKTTYVFGVDDDSKALTFVYSIPTSFRTVQVDYEFRDLPLP